MKTNEERLFYTVSELAEVIPLGRNGLYKLVNSSGFPKIVVGRKILIPVKGLLQWMNENSITKY